MVPELLVANFSQSKRFYTDLLGFTVRFERKEPNFAYLEHEQVHLMIEQVTESSWNTGKLEYPLGRGINLQIEVSDIVTLHNRLTCNNYPLYRELCENWYQVNNSLSGQKEFLVQDPDGYLLRLCQYLGEKPL